ncbi:MAG TPA: ATP-binding protein, partial [Anaerolineales bacterium]|nr:ATP-binding protein [Anaerolineales bacterium]
DQTALALQNIEQAEELRLFYKTNIDRQEMERSHLARELHDEVLNQLTILMMNVDERAAGPAFFEAHAAAVARIRGMISGLRPGVLNFGLATALDQLLGEIVEHSPPEFQVNFALDTDQARYDEEMELHLYRIIQQALQNVLRHSHAGSVSLTGHLRVDEVVLIVADNGRGFDPARLDLRALIAGKHFGLVGMLERAALIGARLEIKPQPGKGTEVRVAWRPPARREKNV